MRLYTISGLRNYCKVHNAVDPRNGNNTSLIGPYTDGYGPNSGWKFSRNVAARLEDGPGGLMVVDMSLWADHLHSKISFIDHAYPWKYNWLHWCQEFARYHWKLNDLPMKNITKTLARSIHKLHNLEEFERKTRELKTWGSLEEVLDKLESTGLEDKATKLVGAIRSKTSTIWSLEALWRDENLTVVRELKRRVDEELRGAIRQELQRIQNGMCTPFALGITKFLSFICIYRLRGKNYDRREDWERLFNEIQKLRGIDVYYLGCPTNEEAEWMKWVKENTALDFSNEERI
ncbi:hypothetical protein CPB86DRAFT_878728 [Serendipita vermifera]|nr:hypothetical protein CPB86DRAFT_878728 [Serendipita vermifera]